MIIENGWHRVEVDAVHGGRAVSWQVCGHEVLTGIGAHPTSYGMYPMAPWAGRIRGNRYAGHLMPVNMEPWAIHGVFFERPWHLVQYEPNRLDLRCTAEVAGIAMECTSRWTLDGAALNTELSVRSDLEVPVILGWHPWFRRVVDGQSARWSLHDATLFARDEGYLPSQRQIPLVDCTGPFDDVFHVPSCRARIDWGAVALHITNSDPWFVVYDEPEDALCVEPQSDRPDATSGPCAVADRDRVVAMRTTWEAIQRGE